MEMYYLVFIYIAAQYFYSLYMNTHNYDLIGVGAVLLQTNKSVSYFSHNFTDTQSRYMVIERELYGTVVACEHFHKFMDVNCLLQLISNLTSVANKALYEI